MLTNDEQDLYHKAVDEQIEREANADKKPVTQTWIERVLEHNIDWDKDCLDPCFVMGGLADAIAQAHEQELRERVAKWEEAGRVVWKGAGTVVHFKAWAERPPVSWVEFGSALDSDLDVLPLPPGTGTGGERVRITVTKEE